MSAPTILISVYFAIGLSLMIVSVASRGKEKRIKGFESSGSGDALDAGFLFFIALLWPFWLTSLRKKDPKE